MTRAHIKQVIVFVTTFLVVFYFSGIFIPLDGTQLQKAVGIPFLLVITFLWANFIKFILNLK